MRYLDYVPYIIATAASLIFIQAVTSSRWSSTKKFTFTAVMAAALFLIAGVYWLRTGEKPEETAMRILLCPIFPHFLQCNLLKLGSANVDPPATSGPIEMEAVKASRGAHTTDTNGDIKSDQVTPLFQDKPRNDPALLVRAGSGQSFRDTLLSGQPCTSCPEMVVAPSGKFLLGSSSSEPEREKTESPQVRVTISKPFAVAKYAVSFEEWDACLDDGGCTGYRPNDQAWGRGKHPVISVDWDEAQTYAAWLSRKTGMNYRLLSETEREYVARAGTTTPFWWSSAITPRQANYNGTVRYAGGGTLGQFRQHTVPVDSFEPNAWGLHNVHGNIKEWTADCWNNNHRENPGDGSARMTGDCARRVYRGGSWNMYPGQIRSASRDSAPADIQGTVIGFRVARSLSQ